MSVCMTSGVCICVFRPPFHLAVSEMWKLIQVTVPSTLVITIAMEQCSLLNIYTPACGVYNTRNVPINMGHVANKLQKR